MKILLDENLPHALRHELQTHDVFTVQYMGWSGVKNGALMALAASNGFNVMVTMDNGVPYQQDVAGLPLALIVLQAASNDIDDLRPLINRLLESLQHVPPKTVVWIS